MNMWIIAGILAGLFVFAGIVVVAANSGSDSQTEYSGQTECSTCGNSCTAESNCGLATCGAVTGGSCGCRG